MIVEDLALDQLDKFVENVLILAHTRGTARKVYHPWKTCKIGLDANGN